MASGVEQDLKTKTVAFIEAAIDQYPDVIKAARQACVEEIHKRYGGQSAELLQGAIAFIDARCEGQPQEFLDFHKKSAHGLAMTNPDVFWQSGAHAVAVSVFALLSQQVNQMAEPEHRGASATFSDYLMRSGGIATHLSSDAANSDKILAEIYQANVSQLQHDIMRGLDRYGLVAFARPPSSRPS